MSTATPAAARWAIGLTVLTGLLVLFGTVLLLLPEARAAEGAFVVIEPEVRQWGYLAAALATGVSSLSAGYAVGSVGAAAIGALAEKPELFGRTLILTGLAEGIAIYGLIVSILILNQLG